VDVELGGAVDVELEDVVDAVVLEAESAATTRPHPPNATSPTTIPATSRRQVSQRRETVTSLPYDTTLSPRASGQDKGGRLRAFRVVLHLGSMVTPVHLVGLRDAETAQVDRLVRRVRSARFILLGLMVTWMDSWFPQDSSAALGRDRCHERRVRCSWLAPHPRIRRCRPTAVPDGGRLPPCMMAGSAFDRRSRPPGSPVSKPGDRLVRSFHPDAIQWRPFRGTRLVVGDVLQGTQPTIVHEENDVIA
jgi:hypothetical protein